MGLPAQTPPHPPTIVQAPPSSEPGAVLALERRGSWAAGSGLGSQPLVARPLKAEERRRAGHNQLGTHSHCAGCLCALIAHRVPSRRIPWDGRASAHRQDRAAAPPQRQSPDPHVCEPGHWSGELRHTGVICSFLWSRHAHIDDAEHLDSPGGALSGPCGQRIPDAAFV
ncbi:hypothetical protein HispidOSU_024335 [Sigmodon hispidus]